MARKRSRFVAVKDEFEATQYINIDTINLFNFQQTNQIRGVNHFKIRIETDICYYNFVIDEDSLLNMCEAMDIMPESF
jgi:hypothetical protein